MFDRRSPHATQMGVGVKENPEGLEGGGDRKMIPTLLSSGRR
jgi:hypothetical protein